MPWVRYAELEKQLEEVDRARQIYELAINQVDMNMFETVWKAYIDMEIDLKEYDRVRSIYRRLLDRTKHVKVISILSGLDKLRPIRGRHKRVPAVERHLQSGRQVLQRQSRSQRRKAHVARKLEGGRNQIQ